MRYLFTVLLSFLFLFDAKAQPAFNVEVVGKGPALYFIPGYSCSGDVWKETVARFKDRYQCHVFTLAGYAGVAPIDTPVLKTVHDELIQYTRTNGIRKPMLVGHSLGAFMSLWISSSEPSLFGKLVCVDGLPFISAMADSSITADQVKKDPRYDVAAVIKSFEQLPSEGYIENNARMMLAQVNDTSRARQIATWSFMSDRKTLAQTIVEISTTDLRNSIASIKQPVLVLGSIYGTEANSYRILNQQYKNVANKTIKVPNSKHFIMYDQPEWFYEQLEGFLK